ncbi:MAG: gliding motility-associated C-terminal domain-containing protein [Bacteroidota bacterium]
MKYFALLLTGAIFSGILFLNKTQESFSGNAVSAYRGSLPTPSLEKKSALTAVNKAVSYKNPIADSTLEKSDWAKNIQKTLAQSEYNIHWQSAANAFQSPNRAQNLRTSFYSDRMVFTPRIDSAEKWEIAFSVQGIGRNRNSVNPIESNVQPFIENNKITFSQKNSFDIEYINTNEGVRQNFIVNEKPAGSGTLNVFLNITSPFTPILASENELVLARANKDEAMDPVLRYKDLKAWDANGTVLASHMQLNENGALALVVDDNQAAYPVTIDPLTTAPNWFIESNQAGANMGFSISTAGDINLDGYSDVLVGLPNYDNGQTNEGAVNLYAGSMAGLTTIPLWTYENNQANSYVGYSVATAGDVNGDGFSDVIIGAYGWDNAGLNDRGIAYIFHGSLTGLSASPNWSAEGPSAGAYFGYSVNLAGDVTNDGFSDVIIGAPRLTNGNTEEGAVYVFYGFTTGVGPVPMWSFEGGQNNARLGNSVAGAGDVNGDGYSDVIVGSYQYDNGEVDEGMAFVFHGSATGLSAVQNWSAESNQASALLGFSVSSAGDVNGDGFSDVLVGAYQFDNAEANEGRVFLYAGSAGGLNAAAFWTYENNIANSQVGYSVNLAGDINADGYSDIIIGASGYSNGQVNEGIAYVFYGEAIGPLAVPTWSYENNITLSSMGSSVAPAGDVNGDGYSDIIIGAPNYTSPQVGEGAVYGFMGSANGLLLIPAWTNESNQTNAQYGYAVNAAGDINADGYDDVIVGAPLYDNGQADEGIVYVYLGSPTGLSAIPAWTFENNIATSRVGFSVASAGDVNGDGFSDVIVGAQWYTNGQSREGAAYLFHGSAAGLSLAPNWFYESNLINIWFGTSVNTAGDVNSDGYSDVIIGAIKYSNGEADEGAAYAFYGSAIGLSATPSWLVEPNAAVSQMGYSVASAGDVNGDGYSDVIVGLVVYSNGESGEGQVRLYYGSQVGLSTTVAWSAESNQAWACIGFFVNTAGDVNGDGFSDFIVGAYNYDNTFADEGVAYVYYGSATGPAAAPNWSTYGGQAGAQYGHCGGSVGDINGDGYSDVIVGSRFYSNPEVKEGGAWIYLGSALGLSTIPVWAVESNQANSSFGYACAGAGDINGDGFSDVIIGAFEYDNGQVNEGEALVYYGTGLRAYSTQFKSDMTSPLAANCGIQDCQFGIGHYSKSPIGRMKGQLIWETRAEGSAFSGTPITNSTLLTSAMITWADLGTAGVLLKDTVDKIQNKIRTRVRARVLYHPTTRLDGRSLSRWYHFGNINSEGIGTVKPFTAVLSGTTAICQGDSIPLTINFTGVSPWTVVLTDGTTPVTINNITTTPYTFYVQPGTTTTYSITTVNDYCSPGVPVSSAVITVNSNPTALVDTINNVSCFGGSNGYATELGSGGLPGYSYVWSNGDLLSTADTLSAGDYFVTITDANGCHAYDTITITQPPLLIDTINPVQNVNCFGENNGQATVVPSGGTAGYSFVWSNGDLLATADTLIAGTYYVTITDAHGCIKTDSVLITQPTALTLGLTNTNVNCFGDSTATATATPGGGSPGYIYQWSNGDATPIASNLPAGTAIVTITDSHGCIIIDSVTITQPTALTATSSFDDIDCNGTSTGYIAVHPSGGSPSYSFLWSNTATTDSIFGLPAGPYSVVITDSLGCTVSLNFNLIQPPLLTISMVSSNVLCFGGNTGSASATPSGGTPGYTYNWSNSATTPTTSGLIMGTYTVTITDTLGCTATTIVNITQPAALGLTLASQDVSCYNLTDGVIVSTSSGGTLPFEYSWSNGDTTSAINNLPPGWYILTLIDSNLCVIKDSVEILNQPLLPITLTSNATNDQVFLGQPVTFTAEPGTYTTYTFYIDSTQIQSGSSNVFITSALQPGQIVSVSAFDNTCPSERDSLALEVIPFPTAFTPNGDGTNDVYLKGYEMRIVNRWGQKLYEGNEGWDGTFNGNKVSPGTYYYFVKTYDIHQNVTEFSGAVMLVDTENK